MSLVLIMGLACAKQGFPPGGPEDKTPPEVVSAVPAQGATGVDQRTRISIGFNEWMEKRSVKESIFISPVPRRSPRIKVEAKTVEVDFVGGLNPQQTYVITVGTGAKDAHGNSLTSSWSLAFSTGERIDRGGISGQAYWQKGEIMGAYVWAYRLDRTLLPDPAVDLPDYITQADASGSFALAYLSPASYRLFTFVDTDKNGKYTLEKDPLGVPTGDIVLRSDEDEVRDRPLMLVVQDTTRPACLSITVVDNIHADLRFSEDIDPRSIDTIRIRAGQERLEEPSPLRARRLDTEDHRICHLVTATQQDGAWYQVHLCDVTDEAGNRLTSESCIVSFQGTAVPDTVSPKIVATTPSDSARQVPLDQGVRWIFTEALDTSGAENIFRLTTTDGERIEGNESWPDFATFLFTTDQRFNSAMTLTASVVPDSIRDMAGNRLSDTLATISFTTLDPDTLGFLTGSVADQEEAASGDLYITAEQVHDPRATYTTVVPQPGPFTLSDLLPGKYLVSVFRDQDGNGYMTSGQPTPLLYSEGFAVYPDTVEIRSRWETQGVDLILRTR